MIISLAIITLGFFLVIYVLDEKSQKDQYIANSKIDEGDENYSIFQEQPQFEKERTVSKCSYKTPKTYIDDYGYRRFIDSNKQVSHWQVEKHLKRKLLPGQVVHHIDGNKLNNRISNLQVFNSQADHQRHHQNQYRYTGSWHSDIPEYSRY